MNCYENVADMSVADSVCSSVSECVYVGKNDIWKKCLNGSICNEWSQLEAYTTGIPPSLRVAVVFILSFLLNRGNTNEPASLSGDSFFAQRRRARNVSDTRVTGDEAQGYEAGLNITAATLYSKIKVWSWVFQEKLMGNVDIVIFQTFFRLPKLF